MPYSLGTEKKSVFLNAVEAHKLHLEFEVAPTMSIKAGMPVELTSDGFVQPLTTATASTTYIGIALMNREEGEQVTVACKGMAVIWADAKDTFSPGPVKWDSFNTTSGYNRYSGSSVTATNMQGWALDSGALGTVIRVLVLS